MTCAIRIVQLIVLQVIFNTNIETFTLSPRSFNSLILFFFSAAAQLGGGVGSDNWIILSISNNVSISVSHPLVFINLARYPILGHSSSIASRLDGKLRRNIPSPKLSVLLTIAFFPSFASVLPSLPSNSQW